MVLTGSFSSTKNLEKQLTEINEKLDTIMKNNQSFRRKLESEISKIRESNGDIADTLDQLIRDWNDL